MTKKIRFCVSAGKRHGFGHLRRCLTLASLALEGGVDVSDIEFRGDLDEAAINLLKSTEFASCWSEEASADTADLAVIDRMFDTMDAEFYDAPMIERIGAGCSRRLLVCSSRTLPAGLPVDVAVGYLLETVDVGCELRTGLEFAPVERRVLEYRERRRPVTAAPDRCLIAFGNWNDSQAPVNCLRALRRIGFAGEVVMITPPAQQSFKAEFERESAGLNIASRDMVEDIHALVADSDLLLGSYGLLTYEALAIGTPTVVVPLKPFMADYSRVLADRGVLSLASDTINGTEDDIAVAVRSLMPASTRNDLRSRCDKIFDGRGLNRLADVMLKKLEPELTCHE